MPKISIPQLIICGVNGKLQFFVSGNVGITKKRAVVPVCVCGTGGKETVFRKRACRKILIKPPLLRRWQNAFINQRTHECEQVSGEVPVISRDDQTANGVLLQNLFRRGIQLFGIDRFVNELRILLQNAGENVLTTLVEQRPFVQGLQKVVPSELFIGAEVIVGEIPKKAKYLPHFSVFMHKSGRNV